MYKIEPQSYGFRLTFGDFISASEMREWVNDSRKALAIAPKGGFGVFVDMRTLKPLPQDARPVMETGQKLYKMSGMTRSVVIVESAMVALQFRNIAQDTGIYDWERYISAPDNPMWEQMGLDWITNGIDPDEK
jgi:hypothetical protein